MNETPDKLVEICARAMCPEPPDGTDRRTGDDGRQYPAGIPHWKAWQEDAVAVLSAIDAAGFVIAPKEPTPEMIEAGHRLHWGHDHAGRDEERENVICIYRAMITATQGSEW